MNILRRYAAFVAFVVITFIVAGALYGVIGGPRALLCGFDAGVAIFIVLIIARLGPAEADAMRRRAADSEPDQNFLSLIAFVIVVVVLTAVGTELGGANGKKLVTVLLSVGTLVLAWAFANILFALHYAHAWYRADDNGKDRGGLLFPGDDPTPDYWDFAYYAFVLGMTFQVSDVQITGNRMRRLALMHGLMAFLFNIGVVALSVSLVASAIGG